MYGGDDSITFPNHPLLVNQSHVCKTLEGVCSSMKITLKCDLRQYNHPVYFLGRWWNPWSGDPNSMCDVKRQMMRFHVTASGQATPEQKLLEKVDAFMQNDRNTPIVGPLAEYVTRKLGHVVRCEQADFMRSYFRLFHTDSAFANEKCAWMDDVIAQTYPDFRTDILENAISRGVSPLALPLCVEVPEIPGHATVDIVVGGEDVPKAVMTHDEEKTISDPTRPVSRAESGRTDDKVRKAKPTKAKPKGAKASRKADRVKG